MCKLLGSISNPVRFFFVTRGGENNKVKAPLRLLPQTHEGSPPYMRVASTTAYDKAEYAAYDESLPGGIKKLGNPSCRKMSNKVVP